MRYLKYFIALPILLSLTACEEVIDIELDESATRPVIEAVLTADLPEVSVFVSETTPYFVNEPPAWRNDALVYLTDEDGTQFEVPLTDNGNYRRIFTPRSGVTYGLTVLLDGVTYQASATVPEVVPIVELQAEYQAAGGPFDEGYRLFTRFSDAPEERNYYRQIFFIDGVRQAAGADLQVSDDAFFDGSPLARLPVFRKIFDPGATITIVFQHLDRNGFDYLNSLADIINAEGGGPNGASAAPGNPNGNWNGGALGYFGAVAADTLAVTLPE